MISFVKLNAAGNDFVLVDGREGLPEPPEELARRLCTRRLSLGADGLLVVEETGELPPLGVAHYEPDGERTFCLNGLRGAAAWLVATGQHPPGEALVLRSDAGDLDAIPGRAEVSVALPQPRSLERRSVLLEDGLLVLGCFVDVGNPQFVVVLGEPSELEAPDLMDRARELRWAVDSFPGGTNVTFAAPDPAREDRWYVRTYERGVEDETLSCGSGVFAAACALVGCPYPEAVLLSAPSPAGASLGRSSAAASRPSALRLHFACRSGEEQVVTFPEGPNSQRVWSRGPVQLVAGGQLWP
ncbi:MAG: hypothetical protein D6731_11640 [Planctomycetota bacterium]|nr:MAG: hypothetical protein D6731_11640 [Planctomycetota bacterium]